MSVYRSASRKRWRYDFEHCGRRHSGYCLNLDGTPVASKAQAKNAERRARTAVEVSPERSLAMATDPTLAEAMVVYSDQLAVGAHGANQRAYVRELLEWFGPAQPIKELEIRVRDYIAWSRNQQIRVYTGGRAAVGPEGSVAWKKIPRKRSDATINRYLDALRKAVRLYGEQRDPATGRPKLEWLPRIPELKEKEHVPRPISDGEIERIVVASRTNWPWVADALILASQMGFRRGEMLGITLDRVDLEKRGVWLRPEDTKAGRGEFVMANRTAFAVLKRRCAQARELEIPWLFWHQRKTKDGRPAKPMPIRNIKRSWRQALKAAAVATPYRFHDAKASFVTKIAMRGEATVATIMELARHRDYETTRRYLQVADAEKRRALDSIAAPEPQSPTQKSRTPVRRGASKSD